jgi:hypothetical protein
VLVCVVCVCVCVSVLVCVSMCLMCVCVWCTDRNETQLVNKRLCTTGLTVHKKQEPHVLGYDFGLLGEKFQTLRRNVVSATLGLSS